MMVPPRTSSMLTLPGVPGKLPTKLNGLGSLKPSAFSAKILLLGPPATEALSTLFNTTRLVSGVKLY